MAQIETTLKDWERADHYFNSFVMSDDPVLEAAIENSDKHNLPDIAVSPAQGKFLHLLLRSIGAKRVLELGTLGGYSTIWLAKALPDNGEVITLELLEHHAKVAAENIEAAGLTGKVKIIVGRAIDTLEKFEPSPPFDLVFIDADKPSNLEYYKHAKRLTRPGGVIFIISPIHFSAPKRFNSGNTCSMLTSWGWTQIVDNVVRYSRVSNPEYTDAKVEGVDRLLHAVKGDPDVDSIVLQNVGAKGYDGFLYAFRK